MFFKRFWQKRYNLSHDNNNTCLPTGRDDSEVINIEEIKIFLKTTA